MEKGQFINYHKYPHLGMVSHLSEHGKNKNTIPFYECVAQIENLPLSHWHHGASAEEIRCVFDDNFAYFFIKTEAILMSTHNIGFYEDLTKIIFELSSNIIKYTSNFFCWACSSMPVICGTDTNLT